MVDNEKEFLIETALNNLEALTELLHTASTGDFCIEAGTLNAVTNMMSDQIIEIRRLIKP